MYFGMARIAERNGKIESARKAYLQILEQDPGHVDSLHRMAITSVHAECLDEAVEYFEKAIHLGEPNEELLCDYGYALYLGENFAAAETVLKRAQKLAPDHPRIANNLALALGRQGKYDEAYELFQRSGDRAEALTNLAFVQSQVGDISYAKDNYHQALGIDPTLAAAANGLYEIHRAFPASDAMLITPFRGGVGDPPERMASQTGAGQDGTRLIAPSDEIDQLIRSISIQPGASSGSSRSQPVVQATYHGPPARQQAYLDAKSSELIVVDQQPSVFNRKSNAPESAKPVAAPRIPIQSRNSLRGTGSSVRKNDSSQR